MSEAALQSTTRLPNDTRAERPLAAILTLGCKLNLADSEAMARRFRDGGWSITEKPARADAIIINSCSVTHVADAKSRHLLRMARRVAPGASVALTGCMLETASAEVVEDLGADLVMRQPDQALLVESLLRRTDQPRVSPTHASAAAQGADVRPFRTRAFVSAQEGCNDVCAFCIVPRTRGRERSKPVDAIVAEVQAREADGVQEVVITGTQLGAWGREQGRRGLYPVLKALLDQTAVPRIRMSSIQPQDLSEEMLDLWADSRLCRHFHLALQSGSQSVLERMRRRYSTAAYARAVGQLRQSIPGVTITTDVIAGFPGETEDEFEETLTFCREMGFAGVHAFPYSQRRGTTAAGMSGQVPEPVKKERVHRLMFLADESSAACRRAALGTTAPVLWESAKLGEGPLVWEGLTDTYIRVYASSEAELENRILPARLEELAGGGVRGVVTAA
jgi:threonylcarbamoyladenosine tRNA methylthiotransferase MtaB